MKDFKAVWLDIAIMVSLAVDPVAATRPFSPTGSTHSNPSSEAPSAQGTNTSEGIVLECVKIIAVGLGLLLVAWRIWGIVKNTQLWRTLFLIVLGGECLAADEAGLAPDGLLDNLPPNTDLELTIRPGATPNPPARGHGTPPASPSSMSPPGPCSLGFRRGPVLRCPFTSVTPSSHLSPGMDEGFCDALNSLAMHGEMPI